MPIDEPWAVLLLAFVALLLVNRWWRPARRRPPA